MLQLDRLTRFDKFPGVDDAAWVRFMAIWQKTMDSIEDQEALQDATIAALQAVQLEILATQQELADQLGLILAAQATADNVLLSNAISASYIVPSMPLTGSDAGTDATITIADFTRYYDDGQSVAVTGGALTGLAYETGYSVYYDDTSRADTSPTFVATTNAVEARHNFAPGRHYVGYVATPASGGGETSGGGSYPPGGGGFSPGGDYEVP